ncbi:hypothetical protein LCGC14_1119880 [marine sediment metagenome]|uniref:Yeast cell wall synthesis Kre9/Knh1-like N-terminal domain-containing protein n=1 Tax=marine sediment metagenome TaxID=412755 RepID=A0A0F9PMF3_9ZZZZ
MKKITKSVIVISVFMLSFISLMLQFDGDISENRPVGKFDVKNSDVWSLCENDALGIGGWSKQGDSIYYNFSTSPSATIEVWALDKGEKNTFESTGTLSGIFLMSSGSGSGVFFPQYESKWYILFIKYTSGCTSVTYTVDFTPAIIVTSPSSSTTVFTESDLLVEWGSKSMSELLKIELFKGTNFQATLETSTLNNGAEFCQIPENLEDGSDYRIKITGLTSGEYDSSDYFTILKRKIEVYKPYKADILVPHTPYIIDWFSRGVSSKVRIDLYFNSTYLLEITNETDNDFYFTWNVWQGENYSTITDSHYQIRVQDRFTPKYFDFSPKFTITSERFLKILTPVVNSSYNSGQIMDITWETDSSAEYVSINLMRDSNTVLQISPSTGNTGSFEWRIPSNLKNYPNYTLYINTTDNSAHAYSERFTIKVINGISGYSLPLIATGIILIGLCIFLRNHKKILSYGR